MEKPIILLLYEKVLVKRFPKKVDGELKITTINDIAKLAGVSITTVSKIINQKDHDISAKTKQRVQEVIKQYNYRPNALASGLKTKKTGTIGLLVPDISNAFFSEVILAVENTARRDGFNVILCNTNDEQARELEYLNVLRDKRVDGIIFISTVLSNHKGIVELADKGMPIVVVDRPIDNTFIKVVQLDNEAGGYMATKHLIEFGHTKIGCITGPLQNKSARDRYNGYLKGLQEAGIPFEEKYTFEGDYRVMGGENGAQALLQEGVTAIFTCNDMMAYGVYKVVSERGLEIPKDISVVGYDDIYLSQILSTPLTSVKQPTYEIGAASASILINMINGVEVTEDRIEFKSNLSIRKSVAPPFG
jgi:LacI family transcriptional regulator